MKKLSKYEIDKDNDNHESPNECDPFFSNHIESYKTNHTVSLQSAKQLVKNAQHSIFS
jgi:hypothetical protein